MPTPIPAELYPMLMDLINQTYLDRVERIDGAQVDDGDNIICAATDGRKALAVRVTDSDIDIRLRQAKATSPQFAAPGKKKKKCVNGISCGDGCISAAKTCRKKTTPKQKAQKKKIVADAKGAESIDAKKENIPAQKESQSVESKLLAMANGFAPDSIQISAEAVEHARHNFLDNSGDQYVANKIAKLQHEVPSLTDDEANAISTWIGYKYADMNAILYGGKLSGGVDREAVETTNLLASKALHKIPPATVEQITKEAASKDEAFDAQQPLGRYMTVPNPEEFVKRYQEALKGGGEIREATFFATSHIDRKDFDFCSRTNNITYEVKAKLDGSGSGRYIDHYKNSASEGEVLYPPSTKFRVTAVTPPSEKLFASGFNLTEKMRSYQKEAKLLKDIEGLAAKKAKTSSGSKYEKILSKLYKEVMYKDLPDAAGLAKIRANGATADEKEAKILASTGKNRATNWIIRLEEI